MRFVGFSFNKINIERFNDKLENLKINTNIDIVNIKEIKSDLFKTKEILLGIKFKYVVSYEPDSAKIELLGNLVLAVETKLSKEILKQWTEKKLPEDFRIALFNFILRKANLKALQLEDEMNLPLHVPFPTLRKQDIAEAKKGEK